MPQLVELQTHSSDKGNLTVFEKILSEGIKRIFYVYDAKDQIRGGHRHKIANVALTCVSGNCKVLVNDGKNEKIFDLDSPSKCLILQPGDWHQMYAFSSEAVLLVLSDQFYDKDDYILEKYPEIA